MFVELVLTLEINLVQDSGYCRPETLSINGQRNIYYRFLIKDYPKPLISPSQEQELSLELIQIHPLEFARQLTMIDQGMYAIDRPRMKPIVPI